MSEQAAARFAELYDAHFDRVLGYALRRTPRPPDAADVVSETFLVAWRRLSEVPAEPETRLWLYAVARRTLANHRRADRRREALGERLRTDLAVALPDHAPHVTTRQCDRDCPVREPACARSPTALRPRPRPVLP